MGSSPPNVNILSRLQQNELFTRFEKAGLPLDEWKFGVIEEDHRGECLAFEHKPTGAHMRISLLNDRCYMTWRPATSQGKASATGGRWATALAEVIIPWIDSVRRDHQAPDLWAALAAQSAITDAADQTNMRGRFTAEEVKQLRAGLDQIERFITTTQPLDGGGREKVKRRFDYLREAAGAGLRKIDFINIFVRTVFQMIVQGLVPPSAYGSVMSHAAAALNSVYQFGLKLLGS
jgi:hypothetical protein